MQILAWKEAQSLLVLGHGITVDQEQEIAEGVCVTPHVPPLDTKGLETDSTLAEQAAITSMHEIASFSLKVSHSKGGKALATKGWNRLWDFHLLSLACKSPCMMLYSACAGNAGTAYAVANRNLIINPLPNSKHLDQSGLEWAAANEGRFRDLIEDPSFSAAMRYFGNAHYLFDLEHRIMLLWAGIEGLLHVEAEHNHRIALYSAIILDAPAEEKLEWFQSVRQAYSLRSRVVHGAKPTPEKLKKGYADATTLLATLLARCVEIGLVPDRDQMDLAALSASI